MPGATAPKKQGEPRKGRGGVSPRIGAPATRGLEVLVEPKGPINNTASFPNFGYHGGPVVKFPQVYATFWGSAWLADAAHLTRAARLTQFLTDLVASQYMNVLSQYGSGSGAGTGCFMRASFLNNVPANLTDPQIRTTIQDCINAGVLPEPANPSNTCVIVYLADNIGINDPNDGLVLCEATNDTAFGYHDFFTTTAGHSLYYAMIPGLTNQCLTESCPGNDGGCSLHLAETQEQRQTQVTSHEFGEMITDPQLNAWFDATSGAENGDICNGEAANLTMGPNTWNVQRQYSKADDMATNGATFCVVTAPNPMPKLVPGPAASITPVARIQQLQAINKILPLPEIHYDASTKKATTNENAIRKFADQLLHPFHHSDLVGDMPGLLRQFADVIEKTPKPK
jgi:hypothetical protein